MLQLLPSVGLALVMLMPELAMFALFLGVTGFVLSGALASCSRLFRGAHREPAMAVA